MSSAEEALLGDHHSNEPHPPGLAVAVDDLCTSYGTTKVLKNIDLHAAEGTIYGVLGPSGCGKTTLLKCILGRLLPRSGSVSIFGLTPGTKGLGKLIGYAPQELALFKELSIYENLLFFSRLNGMSRSELDERVQWLLNFLDLPASTRTVGSLSGGQQRRVSLCVALLHKPKLLLLDEPTVGVDPILRQRIWKFLGSLKAKGVTVIITTHYIEEARQADRVGFLRGGRLLDSGPPEDLILSYARPSLEDVFIDLCTKADAGAGLSSVLIHNDSTTTHPSHNNNNNNSTLTNSSVKFTSNGSYREFEDVASPSGHTLPLPGNSGIQAGDSDNYMPVNMPIDMPVPASLQIDESERYATGCCDFLFGFSNRPFTAAAFIPSYNGTKATALRSLTRLRRDIPTLLYATLLPAIQICIFCLCVGIQPTHVPFGVYSEDVGGMVVFPTYTYVNLGDEFVAALKEDLSPEVGAHALDVIKYKSVDKGVADVKSGQLAGFAYIPRNFTEDLIAHGEGTSNVTQSVHLYVDSTNWEIGQVVITQSENAFSHATQKLTHLKKPVVDVKPVFASKKHTDTFVDFVAPGMVILMTWGNALGLTAAIMIIEKIDGTMERVFSTGTSAMSVIMGFGLSMVLIVIIQNVSQIVFLVFVFKVPLEGGLVTLPLVVLVMMFLAVVGLAYGLLITSIASTELQGFQMGLGTFFPSLLLSGVMWPMSTMPVVLRTFAWALPSTWGVVAMREIMLKGGDITNSNVWGCMAVVVGWTLLCLFGAAWRLR